MKKGTCLFALCTLWKVDGLCKTYKTYLFFLMKEPSDEVEDDARGEDAEDNAAGEDYEGEAVGFNRPESPERASPVSGL